MSFTISNAELLRGRGFDALLVGGALGLALTAGAIGAAWAWLLPILVFADLWLLGYPHVISTFTRTAFDSEARARHRFSLYVLPLLVLAAVLAVAATFGVWSIVAVYFYWQWFHYARQSWGVSKAYQRKAGANARFDPEWLAQVQLWATPVWGVLARSAQGQETFLGLPTYFFPVQQWIVTLAGVIALASFAYWGLRRFEDWRAGRLAGMHALYVLSHHLVFFTAYVFISDVTAGWLVANIWHNAQYLLFVYMFNARRYEAGVEPKARLISALSQPGAAWRYFLFCFAVSTLVYVALGYVALLMIAPILVWQTINFHHYVVDSFLWRKPRTAPVFAAQTAPAPS